jgi:hypothetical protein
MILAAAMAAVLGVACPRARTRRARPLGWTHAQLVRLAWALDAGRPVEQPGVVCRYVRNCSM